MDGGWVTGAGAGAELVVAGAAFDVVVGAGETPPEVEDAIKYVRENAKGALGDAASKVLEQVWTAPGQPDAAVKWQLIPAGDRTIVLFTLTADGQFDEKSTIAAWRGHLDRLAAGGLNAPSRRGARRRSARQPGRTIRWRARRG